MSSNRGPFEVHFPRPEPELHRHGGAGAMTSQWVMMSQWAMTSQWVMTSQWGNHGDDDDDGVTMEMMMG